MTVAKDPRSISAQPDAAVKRTDADAPSIFRSSWISATWKLAPRNARTPAATTNMSEGGNPAPGAAPKNTPRATADSATKAPITDSLFPSVGALAAGVLLFVITTIVATRIVAIAASSSTAATHRKNTAMGKVYRKERAQARRFHAGSRGPRIGYSGYMMIRLQVLTRVMHRRDAEEQERTGSRLACIYSAKVSAAPRTTRKSPRNSTGGFAVPKRFPPCAGP